MERSSCIQQYHRHHQQQQQQYRSKVFVSKYNQSLHISSSQILDFCIRNLSLVNKDLKSTSSHVILRECPFCHKPTGNKIDNFFKLYIQVGGGAYFCHRCGSKGSWFDFTQKMGRFDVVSSSSFPSPPSTWESAQTKNRNRKNATALGSLGPIDDSEDSLINTKATRLRYINTSVQNSLHETDTIPSTHVLCLPMPPRAVQSLYSSNLLDSRRSSLSTSTSTGEESTNQYCGDSKLALEYLMKKRGLTKKTLRLYGVGLAKFRFPSDDPQQQGRYVDADCITFPWILREAEVQEQESLRGANYLWKDREKEERDEGKIETKERKETNTKDNKMIQSMQPRPLQQSELPLNCDSTDSHRENDSIASTCLSESDVSSFIHTSDMNPLGSNAEQSLGPFVVRRIKARALCNKAWQRLFPKGGGWSFFGWHTVPSDAKEVVITEGEYDAMAVYQATGRPSISLPNGCRSLPVSLLPLLERFEKIYLWMDNDGPGREGAEQFAKKIGINRCFLVQPSSEVGRPAPKDANEALLKKMNLEDMIQKARVLPHERILTFSDLRSQVMEELLNPNKYSGVPVPSLPLFTSLIKGFRRGEMTVLTGPTGSGKTTFLGQLSLDFAEQGHSTLWGSFEIKNTRLMHKLLQQFSREPLPIAGKEESVSYLNSLADRFENLPLYFMKFHGGSDIDDVLDAMDYAAYVHDVQHIILDNMQFMISRNQSGSSKGHFDKFDYQDEAIEKFRKFATERNVHVTLVVHPRKEDENAKLGISSVYGSAKATQEADTVLILQYDGTRKYIEVKKNRFDGTLGFCEMHFQRNSGRYSEQPSVVLNQKPTTTPVRKKSSNIQDYYREIGL